MNTKIAINFLSVRLVKAHFMFEYDIIFFRLLSQMLLKEIKML